VLNVAVSPALTGATGAVDQLVPVFQSPEPGLGNQTASTANTGLDVTTTSASTTNSARIEVARMPGSLLVGRVVNLKHCVFTCQAFIDAKKAVVVVGIVSLASAGDAMLSS